MCCAAQGGWSWGAPGWNLPRHMPSCYSSVSIGLSFPLCLWLCSTGVQRFSSALGLLLPSPRTSGGGGRCSHSGGLSLPEPGISAAREPQGTRGLSLDRCPQSPSEDSNEQEQTGARTLPLPQTHIASLFQPWFFKANQAGWQQSCQGFESPYKQLSLFWAKASQLLLMKCRHP